MQREEKKLWSMHREFKNVLRSASPLSATRQNRAQLVHRVRQTEDESFCQPKRDGVSDCRLTVPNAWIARYP
jgi:hypothetical protein